MHPLTNTKAPDFTLQDQEGTAHTLSAYTGGWVLVYFYPKDATPGCTTEAQALRDSWPAFVDLGVSVLGISADNVASHKKFAKKEQLPFPLLADEAKEAIEAYGVWGKKKMMGREYDGIKRSSFLINPEGMVVKVYEKVTPAQHAREVLEEVRKHA